jgi:hypothetical protein
MIVQKWQACSFGTKSAAKCSAGASKMVAIEWYDGSLGYAEPNCPVLALCLDNGRMQLMRHDMDDNAICIDTGIKPKAVKWNHNGSVSWTLVCRTPACRAMEQRCLQGLQAGLPFAGFVAL